ncbi:MAG: hypothetical protein AAF403_06530 [Pseudomonadota bacterium]
MKVNVYTQSIGTDPSATDFMKASIKGAQKLGWYVNCCDEPNYVDGDLHIFWGSWKARNHQHHALKRDIINHHAHFIVLETRLIGQSNTLNLIDRQYVRIALGGYLRDDGYFGHHETDQTRMNNMLASLGRDLKPVETNPDGPFMVIMQRPGDASLRGIDIDSWALKVCHQIKQIDERPIIVRMPAKHMHHNPMILDKIQSLKNVTLSTGTAQNLESSLKQCFCTIAYTSSMSIDSAIEGRPVITLDPGNFIWPCADHEINHESLKAPKLINRDQRICELTYFQWTKSEIESAIPFSRLIDALK